VESIETHHYRNFVFRSKRSPQSWFFIRDYEQVETQPDKRTILKHARISRMRPWPPMMATTATYIGFRT